VGDGPQARSEIEALLVDHGHRPNKQYGQHFLTDPNIVRRIVEVAGVEGGKVIEVGAGTGTLTLALASTARRVVSYEIDTGLVPILTETLAGVPNVDIRIGDVTSLDLAAELGSGPWTMVANLPYNVGTGIVLDTLTGVPAVERFVVMVQTEVAERLVAGPGSRTYGIPSVIVGLHGTAAIALTVPPQVFEPRPRVGSSVVVIDRTQAPPESGRAAEIAATAFGQRRKMLRRSLAAEFADPVAVIEAAGLDPTARPEQLAPADYVALATVEDGTG
jgi:16S rRNA (adenine1518-N6/adenine1519-N6)-dimethyltransferase